MKRKVELDLSPFGAPDYVWLNLPAGELNHHSNIPLSSLDAGTLEDLCDEFRSAVFKKAGKRDPEYDRVRIKVSI